MAFTKIASAGIGSTELVTLHSLNVLNNANIDGVLTYEDVTNVDSVGLITARNGIVVGSGITLSKDGDGFFTGIVTATSYAGASAPNTNQRGISVKGVGSNAAGFVDFLDSSGNVDGRIIADNGALTINADTAGATDSSKIEFSVDGSEKLRITSDGKMGLGITSPTGQFAVSDGTRIAEINPHSSGTFIGNRSNHDVLFQVNAATKAKLDTNGHLTISDGDLVIGTSGHGIDFSATSNTSATGGSTSNELFDDYEEGTWTPIISYQYGSVTSYGTQTGKYTKIGNMVYADFYISLTNKGDPSGSYSYIQGLPFNHTGSTAGVGSIYFFNNFNTNVSYIAYELGGSSPTVAWLTGVVGTQNTAMSYLSGSYFTNTTTLGGQLVYRVSG